VPAGEYFTVRFRRATAAAVQPLVEHSPSLDGPWTSAIDGIDGVLATTTPDGFAPGIDRVEVHIPRLGPRLFVRVGVTLL
jgi:hypothetical protein